MEGEAGGELAAGAGGWGDGEGGGWGGLWMVGGGWLVRLVGWVGLGE